MASPTERTLKSLPLRDFRFQAAPEPRVWLLMADRGNGQMVLRRRDNVTLGLRQPGFLSPKETTLSLAGVLMLWLRSLISGGSTWASSATWRHALLRRRGSAW